MIFILPFLPFPAEVLTGVPTEFYTELPTMVPTEAPTEAPTEVPAEPPFRSLFYVRNQSMEWNFMIQSQPDRKLE